MQTPRAQLKTNEKNKINILPKIENIVIIISLSVQISHWIRAYAILLKTLRNLKRKTEQSTTKSVNST